VAKLQKKKKPQYHESASAQQRVAADPVRFPPAPNAVTYRSFNGDISAVSATATQRTAYVQHPLSTVQSRQSVVYTPPCVVFQPPMKGEEWVYGCVRRHGTGTTGQTGDTTLNLALSLVVEMWVSWTTGGKGVLRQLDETGMRRGCCCCGKYSRARRHLFDAVLTVEVLRDGSSWW
jgi:hypothetical protein